MSKTALQDTQWLQSLPQNLDFEHFFWGQPDEAKVWFSSDDMSSHTNDN